MPVIVSKIVEVCVFRFAFDMPEYLLLRRSKDQSVYPDTWQCISGKIREGERAAEAALREFSEECGLVAERLWVVPHCSTFFDARRDEMNLCPMFAIQVMPQNDPLLSPEHSSFAWLRYEKALERLVWPGQSDGLRIVQEYLLGEKSAAQLARLPL